MYYSSLYPHESTNELILRGETVVLESNKGRDEMVFVLVKVQYGLTEILESCRRY